MHALVLHLNRQLLTVSIEGDLLTVIRQAIRPKARRDNGHLITGPNVAFTLKLLHRPYVPNEAFRAKVAFIGAAGQPAA